MASQEEGTEMQIIPHDSSAPIDMLGREDFIGQLITIVEILASNKKNASYAINGAWGTGKTWILESFERRIREFYQEGTTLNKYVVFHYNCWEYDYYSEPLIAIVAAILDQIDTLNLVKEEQKAAIKEIIKEIGISLLENASTIVKGKTGIDIQAIQKKIEQINNETSKAIAENHDFDTYFKFREMLKQLSKTIALLAEDQTVILVVDELDRCLPEYAIKVLERLHHVFGDIPNMQVILAVDKNQLVQTISSLYGSNTSIERYLKKFIDFELSLHAGDIGNIVKGLYPQYHSCFSCQTLQSDKADDLCSLILADIDIRTCKLIAEKSHLCHRILTSDNIICDSSILCVELFLTVLKQYGLKVSDAKNHFSEQNLFASNLFSPENNYALKKLGSHYKTPNGRSQYFHSNPPGSPYIDIRDLFGLIIGCYRAVLGFNNEHWSGGYENVVTVGTLSVREYVLKFWKLLNLIQ